jgi:beta-lactam-binding protein with PASTA domain
LNRAEAAKAATKYLERDIKRAPKPRRDRLLGSLNEGKKALDTTVKFTEKRFMLADYNYEVTLLAVKVANSKDYIMAALLEIEKQLDNADPAVGDDLASPSAPLPDAAAPPGNDPDGSGSGATPGPDVGAAKVKVPSVDGLPASRAKALIAGAGLVPALSVGDAAEEKSREHTVHSQKPAGGTLLPKGAAVTVVIYGAHVDPATATVPDVIGQTAKDAKSTIADAGFTAAMAMGDGAPDPASEYIAYSQSPAAGTEVNPGATVSVVLYGKYKVKMITVPDVTGLGATEATLRITGAGLVAAKAQGDRAPKATQSNTVQSQDKAAGTRIKEKSTVTLTIFSPHEKNERCNKNQTLYYTAYSAGDYARCSQILADSQDCAFYNAESSDLKDSKCVRADAAYYNAIKSRNYSQARSILAQNVNCDFYSDHMQSLKCSENLSAITAAYHANDMNRFKSILAQSSDCSYYADLVSALRRSRQQRQRNQQLAQAFGQILGAAIKDAMTSTSNPSDDDSSSDGSHTTSLSSSGDSTGTPSRSSSTDSARSQRPSKKCRKVCIRKKVVWHNASDGRHSLCAGGIARPPGPGLRPPKCEKSVRCLEYQTRCE